MQRAIMQRAIIQCDLRKFSAKGTWIGMMGGGDCGISTVRRQIKNPRTSHKPTFNFLLRDVLGILFFCYLLQENSVSVS